jgi:hypothetical protein
MQPSSPATPATPATRTIDVDEEVYDMLARTAATRATDINGVVKYLIEALAVPARSGGCCLRVFAGG